MGGSVGKDHVGVAFWESLRVQNGNMLGPGWVEWIEKAFFNIHPSGLGLEAVSPTSFWFCCALLSVRHLGMGCAIPFSHSQVTRISSFPKSLSPLCLQDMPLDDVSPLWDILESLLFSEWILYPGVHLQPPLPSGLKIRKNLWPWYMILSCFQHYLSLHWINPDSVLGVRGKRNAGPPAEFLVSSSEPFNGVTTGTLTVAINQLQRKPCHLKIYKIWFTHIC